MRIPKVTDIDSNLDLGKYNLVELEVLLDMGIITVAKFDQEVKARNLVHTTFTPPSSRIRD
jgi:hypothetical protein